MDSKIQEEIKKLAEREVEILTSCDETRKTQVGTMKAKPFEMLYKDEEIAVMKVGAGNYRVFMLDENGDEVREVLLKKEVKEGKLKYKAYTA